MRGKFVLLGAVAVSLTALPARADVPDWLQRLQRGEENKASSAYRTSPHSFDSSISDVEDPPENDDGTCKTTKSTHHSRLVFRPDGTLHCRIDQIPQDYIVDIWVLVPQKTADNDYPAMYDVRIDPGTASASALKVRGAESLGDLAKALKPKAQAGVISQAQTPTALTWLFLNNRGSYASDAITVSIKFPTGAVNQDTKINVEPRYTFNLGVVGVGSAGFPDVAVENNIIKKTPQTATLNYYLALEWFPFAWQKFGTSAANGRYFDWNTDSISSMVGLVGGVSLGHPTEQLYLGLSFHPFAGVAITGGWQPRQIQQLKSGFQPGQSVAATDSPLEKVWHFEPVHTLSAGLLIDASVAKTLLSAIVGG